MKIVFFEVQEWEKKLLKKALKGHKLSFIASPLSGDNVSKAKDADIISIFIYSKITSSILKKLPKLKLLVTRSTGYNHIDLVSCKKENITASYVPYYGENTVAEHTFALILSLSRKIHKAYLRTMSDDFSIQGLKGFDLQGKTLGVIGVGHIGTHVVRIARGFGMKVLAVDHHPNKFLADSLGFRYATFNEAIKKSDIITLHVPYRKETHHLINSSVIRKMKKGAHIINTSRGAVVDTKALLRAINKGKLGGAGLDVIEGEALIKEERELLHITPKKIKQIATDHNLMHNENVVFTPHIAFYSQEALERILKTTISNINSFILGKPENCIKNV